MSDDELARELLEDYLDRLAAGLVGRLPLSERLRLKDEAAFHLERLQNQFRAEGLDALAATRCAVERYGSPHRMAEDFVEASFENAIPSPLFRFFGRGAFTAFAIFAAAQLVFMTLLQLRVFLPSGAAYALPLSPGTARTLLPDPLPLPERPGEFVLLYGYPFVAPILAGLLVGALIPARAGRRAAFAIMPIALYSFVVGALTLPQTAGVLFALVQVVWWIPVGAGTASLASTLSAVRRGRRESR